VSAVRAAAARDLAEIERVQRSANSIYAPYGLAEHLDALSTPREELERGIAQGLSWVATDASDTIVGFALASAFGHDLHLDEIGVVPSSARRGLGSRLLETVLEEGRVRAARRLTLLTVDFVPWTLGFYAHQGFHVLARRELDARLVALLAIVPGAHPPEAVSFDGRIVLTRNLQAGGASLR
jgi:GNAT superfamily N-acetyltransferase